LIYAQVEDGNARLSMFRPIYFPRDIINIDSVNGLSASFTARSARFMYGVRGPCTHSSQSRAPVFTRHSCTGRYYCGAY